MYAETDDVRGGMGLEGAAEFQKFVEAGGVLLTFGVASYFPAEFGDRERRGSAERSGKAAMRRGRTCRARSAADAPRDVRLHGKDAAGALGGRAAPAGGTSTGRVRGRSPGSSPDRPQVIARFTGGEAGVLSGLMRDPDQIRNRPMIVDAPAGKGRVILFANNPIYRWQTFGEHAMVFNALLFHNDFPAPGAKPATTTAQP